MVLFLEQWMHCQGMWLYLEPIFASSDIQSNMSVTDVENLK